MKKNVTPEVRIENYRSVRRAEALRAPRFEEKPACQFCQGDCGGCL